MNRFIVRYYRYALYVESDHYPYRIVVSRYRFHWTARIGRWYHQNNWKHKRFWIRPEHCISTEFLDHPKDS